LSLPKGFGASTDACPVCQGRVVWSAVDKTYICKNGCQHVKAEVWPDGKGEPFEIPITKHQGGLYLWYGMFSLAVFGAISAMFTDLFFGIMLFFMVVILGSLFGFMVGVALLGWKIEETLPWLKPILGKKFHSQYHFKKEFDYSGKK